MNPPNMRRQLIACIAAVVLGASPAYGHDKNMTQQIDALGLLIKELADAVVVLQLKLEQDQDSTLLAGQN